jgi:hypothetical protein
MTKNEREQMHRTFSALKSLGFTFDECEKLRRISMTLRRWFELECGNGDDRRSWAIERDETTEIPYMVTQHYRDGKTTRHRVADRETGARRRLSAIIRAVNERRFIDDSISATEPKCDDLSTYIQSDPRGAALYILRPGDVPEGKDPAAYYSRGICIC